MVEATNLAPLLKILKVVIKWEVSLSILFQPNVKGSLKLKANLFAKSKPTTGDLSGFAQET